ncbi:MAG: ABC transporter permease [Desulfobacteraceae bacterium]|nr:MAG: ABC transporter permease [Desulfobacteraceae bacterium]
MDLEFMLGIVPQIFAGARLTVFLAVLSLVVGFGLAVLAALMRRSKASLLSAPVSAYVFIIRGTPLLVQLFFIYYGLGQFEAVRQSILWSILKSPVWCAFIALTLNTAAYGSEIIRGGLEAVPWGEMEAGRAFGMSGSLLFRRVIFPIAIRQALPAYGNEVILMVKATSLASTITIMEMTGIANVIMAESYRPMEAFIVAGGFYLTLNFIMTRLIHWIEWRLSGHLRPYRGAPAAGSRVSARPLAAGRRAGQFDQKRN